MMKSSDQISLFVRDAFLAGHPPEAVRAALISAGWPPSEADAALLDWRVVPDMPDMPPVPRPRPYLSAREAFLFGLLFLSLGAISWHISVLGFELIDRLLPDGRQYFGYSSSVRWAMAALLTFGPLFVVLDRRLNRDRRQAAGSQGDGAPPVGGRSLVRRWIASMTLMLAALVLLSDLVLTIYMLLDGDLTLRFILKSALVAVMAALILLYYRDEMDG